MSESVKRKKATPKKSATTVLVSREDAEMLHDLAKDKGLTIHDYFKRHGRSKFRSDYDGVLKRKAAVMDGRTQEGA